MEGYDTREDSAVITLSGEISGIVLTNEENGYAVFDV